MGGVIKSFRDRGTTDVFLGIDSHEARRCRPSPLWPVARRKLDQINRVLDVGELAHPPGNRLERLRGERRGQYSVRINQRFRICFRWEEGHAYQVEITDYHG